MSFLHLSNKPFIELHGIRISPRELILKNAYEGKTYRERITFQNISDKPVSIATGKPSLFSIKLLNALSRESLCCGLKVHINILYTYTRILNYVTEVHAQLPIVINDNIIHYHIFATESSGAITCIPRSIQFGTINLGNSVHDQHLVLYNKGHKTTKFEFDLANNELGLIIKPSRGFIPALGKLNIEVDIIGFTEGVFAKQIWIKCDRPFMITISVSIISPKLTLKHIAFTERFTPIVYVPIYRGCKCTNTVVIYNHNTLKTMFMVVPEIKDQIYCMEDAIKLDDVYQSFEITPADGQLNPYEEKQVDISFVPPISENNIEEEYFIFFRIVRIECMDIEIVRFEKEESKKPGTISGDFTEDYSDEAECLQDLILNMDKTPIMEEPESDSVFEVDNYEKFLRLCIFAVIRPVEVEVYPEVFDIGAMSVNTTVDFSLTLCNKSHTLPIYYHYSKVAFIEMYPSNGIIKSRETVRIDFKFSPLSVGPSCTYIQIELLYYNQPVDKRSQLVCVGKIEVPLLAHVKSVRVKAKPKFNMGITPAITNEVGIEVDNVNFSKNGKYPRMAMLGCKENDTALIAFPNDRSQSIRPWRRTDVVCRTIFAKIPRVVSLQDEYTLTTEEQIRKKKNMALYKDYFKKLKTKRFRKDCLENIILEEENEYSTNENKLQVKMYKDIHCKPYYVQKKTPIRYDFLRLTPSQIYSLILKPRYIKLGKVTVNSLSKCPLSIENKNPFPIRATLKINANVDKTVFKNLPQTFIVESSETVDTEIFFKPWSVGKFNTLINICINDQHYIPMLLLADVVVPSVKIYVHEIIIDDTNTSKHQYINLHNELNTDVVFSWVIPARCCFSVLPMSGSIPKNRIITSEIKYRPDFSKRNTAQLIIAAEGGCATVLDVNSLIEKCQVKLLHSEIIFSNIPINIPKVQINTLRNYGQDTILFIIKNPKPCPGVEIKPTTGSVKGRSDLDLMITVHMQVLAKFECTVEIEFQHTPDMTFTISGTVEIPNINLKIINVKLDARNEKSLAALERLTRSTKRSKPVNLKRVPAGSLDILPFIVTNLGHSEVILTFLKESFPEITIANSPDIQNEFHPNEDIILESGQKVLLYIHFFPLDVSMYEFYLPIVINKILGPASKENDTTLYPNTFLKQYLPLYESEHITIMKSIHRMAILPVSTISTRHPLRFSKTFFEFSYFPNKLYRAIESYEFKIRNSMKKITEFCIGIHELHPNFELKCLSPEAFVYTKNDFMVFQINSESELKMLALFNPKEPGTYNINLPIYIKGLWKAAVFNYIQFSGKYPNAIFICPKWIYLDPIPTFVKLKFESVIKASFHGPNCVINVSHTIPDLQVEISKYPSENNETQISFNLFLKVLYNPTFSNSFEEKCYITCNCGGFQEINITGYAGPSIITTYLFQFRAATSPDILMQSREYLTFPENADNEYFKYMNKMKSTLELWLYEQVFFSSYYHFIPQSLTGVYKNISKTLVSKRRMLVIVKILHTFLGDKVMPYLIKRDMPTEEIDRINYTHATYKNILIYLRAQGAYTCHIRPRLLLNYSDYCIYLTKIRHEKHKTLIIPVADTQFELRSKQSWLDLLLQIFRTVVLAGVTDKNLLQPSGEVINYAKWFPDTVETDNEVKQMSTLLLWLNQNYETQRNALTELITRRPKGFTLEPRNIQNFTTDLADGIVFACVTMTYCPYLIEHLKDMYICVNSPERAFHNATQLISAWKLVKCSFSLEAADLSSPSAVQMIMFTVYLYDVFPTLIPIDTIFFKVALSRTDKKQILLNNPNFKVLYYHIEFLNNEMGSFTLPTLEPDDPHIMIPPNHTFKIDICYQAKRIHPVRSVILFCGDTPEHMFSKSVVYMLVAETCFAEIDEEDCLTIPMNLYSSDVKTFEIRSPYKTAATYDIYLSNSKVVDVQTANIYSWSENKLNIKPRVLHCVETNLECDDQGLGRLNLYIFCLRVEETHRWFVFSNDEVGDFFVHAIIKATNIMHGERIELEIPVPENWDDIKCTCKTNDAANREKCPRSLIVHIPCQNNYLWKMLSKSLLMSVPPHEAPVWSKYIVQEVGLHIVKWLLDDSTDKLHHIFHCNAPYRIENSYREIELPKTLIIRNVRSSTTIPVRMHVSDDNLKRLNDYEISLQSEDGSEIRLYSIYLKKPFDSDESLLKPN